LRRWAQGEQDAEQRQATIWAMGAGATGASERQPSVDAAGMKSHGMELGDEM